ncbi:MAG: bifunctional adenosylcobinamide kinase/adenosylcobinamide-phosphate guanylyltransferase [Sporichthyaceae bacterium]
MASLGPARRVLVLGGARSGKSAAAEAMAERAAAGGAVTYVATAAERTDDPEWAARIALHRDRRPPSWTTVETAELVAPLTGAGVVLIDCLALWLTRTMDDCGAWDEVAWDSGLARSALGERTDALLAAWSQAPGTVFAVSNEVGLGVVPAHPAGRRFRDELGRLNQRLAAVADEVYLVVAGLLLPLHDPLGCARHDC